MTYIIYGNGGRSGHGILSMTCRFRFRFIKFNIALIICSEIALNGAVHIHVYGKLHINKLQ